MAMVKVMLKRKYPRYPKGYMFKMWGYDFVVQKDGTAIGSVPEAHLKPSLKAGRFLLYEKQKAKEDKIDMTYLDTFGYDVGTYYGVGSLDALHEKIKQLRKDELRLFAESRLDKKFTSKTGKQRMVIEVMEYIKDDIAKQEEQFARLEEDVEEVEETKPEEEKAEPVKQTKEELLAELDEIEKKVKAEKEK